MWAAAPLFAGGFLFGLAETEPSHVSLWVSVFLTMRCPYLEQIIRKQTTFLKVFQADCHVDGKVHRFRGVVKWPSPPCIGKMATCALYQEARSTEDLRLRRLID